MRTNFGSVVQPTLDKFSVHARMLTEQDNERKTGTFAQAKATEINNQELSDEDSENVVASPSEDSYQQKRLSVVSADSAKVR